MNQDQRSTRIDEIIRAMTAHYTLMSEPADFASARWYYTNSAEDSVVEYDHARWCAGTDRPVQQVTTLRQFIQVVDHLSDIGQAYEVFEHYTAEPVREQIYRLNPHSRCTEPFRSAMHCMGFIEY